MAGISRLFASFAVLACLGWASLASGGAVAMPTLAAGMFAAVAPTQHGRVSVAMAADDGEAGPAKRSAKKAAEQEKQSDEKAATTTPSAAVPSPKRVLPPPMVALRDRVRRTLAAYRGQTMSLRENTATDLIHACLAFGCATEVSRDPSSAQKINGVTCLCWNYPCAGREPLMVGQGHLAARVGYGLQERPGQFLAVLALSRVPANYPARVGEHVGSVADLVESEKLACRSGSDLSLPLIGLAYYADQMTWQNDLGESWSVERIVTEQLAHTIASSAEQSATQLLSLAYAVERRAKHQETLEGDFLRAQKRLREIEEYALKLQNADGSWSPNFPAARTAGRDPATQLSATGHVLEWLAISLPEDRLQDPRVVRAVEYVNTLLGGERGAWNLRASGSRDIGAVMHALHALAAYDERWFQPADVEKPATEKATTSQKTTAAGSASAKADRR